jgi:DNA-binding NarL/FixJ family response regulator
LIRLLVVDDQQLVRTGFRMILDAEPDLEVVAEAGDGAEAVEVARRTAPDVTLMDIRMPVMDGVEATRRLAATTKVLILTTFDLDEYVYDALRAGASGFLLKDTPPEDLAAAVRVVAAGEALLAPSVTKRLVAEFASRPGRPSREAAGVDLLTEREREVLEELARGHSNAEIAERLYLGETTVKTHVGRILMKLGVRDRVQAVVLAYETGIVTPGTSGPP